ncbi:mucin-5AC-like [Diaphorina citri]|uniref:Mucin-5AC-like n=1 Tax=Diaphorina citri TaxID=121845 RepID=A0A3Q0JLV9_DIACI|nr:mucin-5AC-like [Diaphorina citri]
MTTCSDEHVKLTTTKSTTRLHSTATRNAENSTLHNFSNPSTHSTNNSHSTTSAPLFDPSHTNIKDTKTTTCITQSSLRDARLNGNTMTGFSKKVKRQTLPLNILPILLQKDIEQPIQDGQSKKIFLYLYQGNPKDLSMNAKEDGSHLDKFFRSNTLSYDYSSKDSNLVKKLFSPTFEIRFSGKNTNSGPDEKESEVKKHKHKKKDSSSKSSITIKTCSKTSHTSSKPLKPSECSSTKGNPNQYSTVCEKSPKPSTAPPETTTTCKTSTVPKTTTFCITSSSHQSTTSCITTKVPKTKSSSTQQITSSAPKTVITTKCLSSMKPANCPSSKILNPLRKFSIRASTVEKTPISCSTSKYTGAGSNAAFLNPIYQPTPLLNCDSTVRCTPCGPCPLPVKSSPCTTSCPSITSPTTTKCTTSRTTTTCLRTTKSTTSRTTITCPKTTKCLTTRRTTTCPTTTKCITTRTTTICPTTSRTTTTCPTTSRTTTTFPTTTICITTRTTTTYPTTTWRTTTYPTTTKCITSRPTTTKCITSHPTTPCPTTTSTESSTTCPTTTPRTITKCITTRTTTTCPTTTPRTTTKCITTRTTTTCPTTTKYITTRRTTTCPTTTRRTTTRTTTICPTTSRTTIKYITTRRTTTCPTTTRRTTTCNGQDEKAVKGISETQKLRTDSHYSKDSSLIPNYKEMPIDYSLHEVLHIRPEKRSADGDGQNLNQLGDKIYQLYQDMTELNDRVKKNRVSVDHNICVEDQKGNKDAPIIIDKRRKRMLLARRKKKDYYSGQRAPVAATINNISNVMPSSPLLSQYKDIPPHEFCPDECITNTAHELCNCLDLIPLPKNKLVELVIADTEMSFPRFDDFLRYSPFPSSSFYSHFLQPDDVDNGRYDQPNFVSTNLCTRSCEVNSPKTCYWKFTLEAYSTLNKACGNCTSKGVCTTPNAPQCVMGDGYERSILVVNRRMAG